MKTKILSLFLALVSTVGTAAESYFGNKAEVFTLSDTNYVIVVLGNGTNSLVRKVAKTNLFDIIKPTTVRLGSVYIADTLTVTNPASFLDIVDIAGDLDVVNITADGTVTAAGFTLSGTGGGADTFTATNSKVVVNRIANVPGVNVTNIIGLTHLANASVMTADANQGQRFTVTNRLAQNSTLFWTNAAEGQRLHLTLRGAASGGSDYYLTNVFPTGFLVLDSNSTNTAAALSRVLFVQDGTKAELDVVVDRFDGTNFANVAVAQPVQ